MPSNRSYRIVYRIGNCILKLNKKIAQNMVSQVTKDKNWRILIPLLSKITLTKQVKLLEYMFYSQLQDDRTVLRLSTSGLG